MMKIMDTKLYTLKTLGNALSRISHPDQMFICKNMVDDQVVTGISSV